MIKMVATFSQSYGIKYVNNSICCNTKGDLDNSYMQDSKILKTRLLTIDHLATSYFFFNIFIYYLSSLILIYNITY